MTGSIYKGEGRKIGKRLVALMLAFLISFQVFVPTITLAQELDEKEKLLKKSETELDLNVLKNKGEKEDLLKDEDTNVSLVADPVKETQEGQDHLNLDRDTQANPDLEISEDFAPEDNILRAFIPLGPFILPEVPSLDVDVKSPEYIYKVEGSQQFPISILWELKIDLKKDVYSHIWHNFTSNIDSGLGKPRILKVEKVKGNKSELISNTTIKDWADNDQNFSTSIRQDLLELGSDYKITLETPIKRLRDHYVLDYHLSAKQKKAPNKVQEGHIRLDTPLQKHIEDRGELISTKTIYLDINNEIVNVEDPSKLTKAERDKIAIVRNISGIYNGTETNQYSKKYDKILWMVSDTNVRKDGAIHETKIVPQLNKYQEDSGYDIYSLKPSKEIGDEKSNLPVKKDLKGIINTDILSITEELVDLGEDGIKRFTAFKYKKLAYGETLVFKKMARVKQDGISETINQYFWPDYAKDKEKSTSLKALKKYITIHKNWQKGSDPVDTRFRIVEDGSSQEVYLQRNKTTWQSPRPVYVYDIEEKTINYSNFGHKYILPYAEKTREVEEILSDGYELYQSTSDHKSATYSFTNRKKNTDQVADCTKYGVTRINKIDIVQFKENRNGKFWQGYSAKISGDMLVQKGMKEGQFYTMDLPKDLYLYEPVSTTDVFFTINDNSGNVLFNVFHPQARKIRFVATRRLQEAAVDGDLKAVWKIGTDTKLPVGSYINGRKITKSESIPYGLSLDRNYGYDYESQGWGLWKKTGGLNGALKKKMNFMAGSSMNPSCPKNIEVDSTIHFEDNFDDSSEKYVLKSVIEEGRDGNRNYLKFEISTTLGNFNIVKKGDRKFQNDYKLTEYLGTDSDGSIPLWSNSLSDFEAFYATKPNQIGGYKVEADQPGETKDSLLVPIRVTTEKLQNEPHVQITGKLDGNKPFDMWVRNLPENTRLVFRLKTHFEKPITLDGKKTDIAQNKVVLPVIGDSPFRNTELIYRHSRSRGAGLAIVDPTYSFTIVKTDINHRPIEKQAEFVIYKIEKNNEIALARYNTNEEGKITFKGLKAGNYKIVEKKAPEGYVIGEVSEYKVNIDEAGLVTINGLIKTPSGEFQITNPEANTNFEIRKLDEKGLSLTGAKFILKKGSQIIRGIETPQGSGRFFFKDLDKNSKYILEELEAPPGYEKIDGGWNVTIDQNGRVSISGPAGVFENNVLRIKNKKIPKARFLVRKIDDSPEKNPLKGVEFTLYTDSDLSKILEIKNTGNKGIAIFQDLEKGTYYLKETKTIEGFELIDKVWKIDVDENGKVSRSEFTRPIRSSMAVSVEESMRVNLFSLPKNLMGKNPNFAYRNITPSNTPTTANLSTDLRLETAQAILKKSATKDVNVDGQYDVNLEITAKEGTIETETLKDTNLILMLENSKNMSSGFRVGQNLAVSHLKDFIDKLSRENPNVKIGLIVYDANTNQKNDSNPNLSSSVLANIEKISTHLNKGLKTKNNQSNGGLNDAIDYAKVLLSNSKNNTIKNNIIINISPSFDGRIKSAKIIDLLNNSTAFYQLTSNDHQKKYKAFSQKLKVYNMGNANAPQTLAFKDKLSKVLEDIKTNGFIKEIEQTPGNGIRSASLYDNFDTEKFELIGPVSINKGILEANQAPGKIKLSQLNLAVGESVTINYKLKLKANFFDGKDYRLSTSLDGDYPRLLVDGSANALPLPDIYVKAPLPKGPIDIEGKVNFHPQESSYKPQAMKLNLIKIKGNTRQKLASQEVSDGNNWTARFLDMPRTDPVDNEPINYVIDQEFPKPYDEYWTEYRASRIEVVDGKTVNIFSFTNFEKKDKDTSLRVSLKVPKGASKNMKPIIVRLKPTITINGQEKDVPNLNYRQIVSLSDGENILSWDNLPSLYEGKPISYDVEIANEDEIKDFFIAKERDGKLVKFEFLNVDLEVVNYRVKLQINKINQLSEKLSQVVFELRKIVDEQGQEIKNSRPVEKTTNSEGVLTFTNLSKGTYKLVEKTAPEGYKIQEGRHWIVTVDSTGQLSVVEHYKEENQPQNLIIKNILNNEVSYKAKGNIEVELDWIDDGISIKEGVSVFLDTTVEYEGNTYSPNYSLPEKDFTGEGGSQTWKNVYKKAQGFGTYLDIGFKPRVIFKNNNTSGWKIRYDYPQGEDKVKITIFKPKSIILSENSFDIVNDFIKPDVEFTKKGPSKDDPSHLDILAGVEFQLERLKQGGDFNNDQDFEPYGPSVSSGQDGKIHFTKLESGHYRLKETKALPGFYNPGLVREFKVERGKVVFIKIDQQGSQEDLTIINEKDTEIPIKIIKKDADGKVLEGVEFRLEGNNLKEALIGKTNAKGDLVFEGHPDGLILPQGLYYLIETKGLEGYIVNDRPRPILVSGDFTIPQVTNPTDQTANIVKESKYFHFKNGYYYPMAENTSEIIKPNKNEGIRIDTIFDFSGANIKPGDYFKLYFSDNITPQGDYDVERLKTTLVLSAGKGIMASGEYVENDNGERYIKFTFTNFANLHLGKAKFSKTFFIDRYKIKNNIDNLPIRFAGTSSKTGGKIQNVNVAFTPTTTGQLVGNVPDIGGFITYQDTINGNYTQVIYLNKNQKSLFDINLKVGPTDKYSSLVLNSSNTTTEVYRVKSNKEKVMPNSWGVNIEADIKKGYLERVNKLPKFNDAGNELSMDFGIYNRGYSYPNTSPYIVIIKGKYDLESKNDLSMIATLKTNYYNSNQIYVSDTWTWKSVNVLTSINSKASGRLEVLIVNPKNKIEFTKIDGSMPDQTNQLSPDQGQTAPVQGISQNPSALEGAEFELRKKDGETFVKLEDSVRKSGTDGRFGWEKLPKGEYEVWEIKPPTGYIIRGKVASFTVDDKGNIINIKDKAGNPLNDSMYIENFKAQYPKTGGLGSEIFIALGSLLMLASFIELKRREKKL